MRPTLKEPINRVKGPCMWTSHSNLIAVIFLILLLITNHKMQSHLNFYLYWRRQGQMPVLASWPLTWHSHPNVVQLQFEIYNGLVWYYFISFVFFLEISPWDNRWLITLPNLVTTPSVRWSLSVSCSFKTDFFVFLQCPHKLCFQKKLKLSIGWNISFFFFFIIKDN